MQIAERVGMLYRTVSAAVGVGNHHHAVTLQTDVRKAAAALKHSCEHRMVPMRWNVKP